MQVLRLSFLLFLPILFAVKDSAGQFTGGTGDGHDGSVTVQINLNGGIVNAVPLWQGGAGDGYDEEIVASLLNGTVLGALYAGGTNDGNDDQTVAAMLDGTHLASLFNGGPGDGCDDELVASFLNGVVLAVMYDGGPGDGYDEVLVASMLEGTNLSAFFDGGSGDGYHEDLAAVFLDGSGLIYSGGIGDGFDRDMLSAFLNGTDQLVLFNGGLGDGFDKWMYEGVLTIDPPVFCFVVNTHNSGPGSLRFTVDCTLAGDTVFFDTDLHNVTIVLDSTIIIGKEVTIYPAPGQQIAVDGTGAGQAVRILPGAIVEIAGLEIIGSNGPAGVIWNEGILLLNAVQIKGDGSSGVTLLNSGSLEFKSESGSTLTPN